MRTPKADRCSARWTSPKVGLAFDQVVSRAMRLLLASTLVSLPGASTLAQIAPSGRATVLSSTGVGRPAAAAIQLADGSVVHIGADADPRLEQLADRSGNRPNTLQRERGRADGKVKPQRARRFEVRSPLAVAGVRGAPPGQAWR